MKAMILAAGRGMRLRPMTDQIPKALVEVGGVPLIEHNIRRMASAGISEFVVNTAWLGGLIRDRLESGGRLGVSIVYSDEGDSALETGGGIRKALPLLGDSPFWVVNADIWCDFRFQLRELTAGEVPAHVVLVGNPPHNRAGDFDVDSAERLRPEPGGPYTFSGISMLSPRLFDSHEAGSFPLAPLIRKAAAAGQVSAEVHTGEWFDVGTMERLQELEAHLGVLRA